MQCVSFGYGAVRSALYCGEKCVAAYFKVQCSEKGAVLW